MPLEEPINAAEAYEQRAAELEAQAHAFREKAEMAREQEQPISPHTKLPVTDPESQAVERIRSELQLSLNSACTPEEAEALLRGADNEEQKGQDAQP